LRQKMNDIREPGAGAGTQVSSVPVLRSQLDRNLGGIILGILVVGCLIILRPFVSALLWAVVLSYSSWPIYAWIRRRLGGRRTLAALIMTLGIILLFLVPFLIVGSTLAGNVQSCATAAKKWLEQGPPPAPAWLGKIPVIGGKATARWEVVRADSGQLWKEARRVLEPVSAWAVRAVVALAGGLIQLALSILIALFLFRDGAAAADRLDRMLNRVAGERGHRLLEVAGSTIRGVVYGILGTSLVQAVLAGIGFFLAGVPAVGLLSLLTFFASLVPLGTALIWLPAALWLFAHGANGWGAFTVVWGVIVGNIDNFIRPLLISQGSQMPFILILFGVLGGALTFGLIGIFLGPTLLSLGFRLFDEWTSLASIPAQTETTSLAPR
jgi:predicted PurR-regulated permease PerM